MAELEAEDVPKVGRVKSHLQIVLAAVLSVRREAPSATAKVESAPTGPRREPSALAKVVHPPATTKPTEPTKTSVKTKPKAQWEINATARVRCEACARARSAKT